MTERKTMVTAFATQGADPATYSQMGFEERFGLLVDDAFQLQRKLVDDYMVNFVLEHEIAH